MISRVILQNLLANKEYWKKTLPYLKSEYFSDPAEKLVFDVIGTFSEKYGSPPTIDALRLEIDEVAGSDERAGSVIDSLYESSDIKGDHLLDKTEEFCQDMALQGALRTAVQVLEGKHKDLGKGAIPDLLQKALGVSFDVSVGHDLIRDWKDRFDAYHRTETKIPFDVEFLNKVTKGGVYRKTMTCFMGPSGSGKSIFLCHGAASHLAMGLNVLYVTCELSEERVAERIEMNLLDCSDDDLANFSLETYEKKIQRLATKVKGRLVIKEYPGSTIGAAHIRHLLQELKNKDGFVPDVIYVDYVNILTSTRVKLSNNVNSYTLVKCVAEELRALAIDHNVALFTATQTNKDGYNNSDIDMSNTAESMGLVHTLDLFFAIITNDDLARDKQVILRQLKNRYRDETMDRKFMIGMDKSRMRLYNLEASAQQALLKDKKNPPAIDLNQVLPPKGKFSPQDLEGFS